MDNALMERLLQNKDKGKASKADKEAFGREWLDYVHEKGFNDLAETYLYSGFPYQGMMPLMTYLKQSDDKSAIVNRFLAGKSFYKNKEKTFKMALQLVALLMIELPENKDLIANVILRLPELSINKEKKRLVDIAKSTEKNFIRILTPETILPDIHSLGLRPATITMFREMMADALDSLDPKQISTTKDLVIITNIRKWLSNKEDNIEKTVPADIRNSDCSPAITAKTPDEEDKSIYQSDLSRASDEKADQTKLQSENKKHTWREGINITIGAIKKLETELTLQQSENQSLIARNTRLINERDSLQATLTQERENSKSLYESVTCMKSENSLLLGQVAFLKKQVDDKDAEIADRIKMADIISRDKTKQSDETIKRLSGEVKSFYKDFSSADDVTMSIDLGEIMRDQLREVFKILQKNGIYLE